MERYNHIVIGYIVNFYFFGFRTNIEAAMLKRLDWLFM